METEQETTTQEPLTGTTAEVFEETPASGQETTTQETTTQEPAKPTLSAEDITGAIREGFRATQPPVPEKQWTQEELDAAFNVWKPTQELVERIRAGGEDGLKAMLEMREGLSKQFGTLLQYSIEVAKKEMLGQVGPALTYAQEQAAAKDREAFFAENEDLKPYEALTQTVFNALKAEGYKAKTQEEAFKTLADRTRALLPTNGNGAGAGQPSGARTTTPTQKRPASLSSGSQAGGGGHSAPVAPFPGAEIWD